MLASIFVHWSSVVFLMRIFSNEKKAPKLKEILCSDHFELQMRTKSEKMNKRNVFYTTFWRPKASADVCCVSRTSSNKTAHILPELKDEKCNDRFEQKVPKKGKMLPKKWWIQPNSVKIIEIASSNKTVQIASKLKDTAIQFTKAGSLHKECVRDNSKDTTELLFNYIRRDVTDIAPVGGKLRRAPGHLHLPSPPFLLSNAI